MFELPKTAAIQEWTAAVAGDVGATDGRERLDLIRALEELKCAAAAAQAILGAAFDQSQRDQQREQGVPSRQLGRGVASELAVARRESPHRGQQHLGLGKVLVAEMPHTLAAFRAGKITEWAATILVRETACLDLPDRQHVDEQLAGDVERLERMGVRELEAEAKKLAYALDPQAQVERRARAEADRRVTLRPAPDTMSHLSALLPVAQGVAVFATLTREADRLRASGDPRSKGQIMADTLTERVTGQSFSNGVRVTVNVVISDEALFSTSSQPAWCDGYGPVPADLVRDLATTPEAIIELRRLYARPGTGRLVAMESRSRCFPTGLATMIRFRDQTCRTPWCDAPIRHIDHAISVEDGGPTSHTNGQGLCEACNHAKQAPDWSARPRPEGEIVTSTPTGLTYTTAPPGVPPPAPPGSRVELYLADLVLAS